MQRETLADAAGIWRRLGSDFDAGWARIVGPLTGVVEAAQREAASQAAAYVPSVMDELGRPPRVEGRVNPAAFVGVAGSGVPLDDVLGISVIRAKQAVGSGATVHQARHDAGVWLRGTISTVLSDTGRAAERVGMASGRVSSYARMLVPPSCSRCVVLAGRLYRSRDAFERHPQCFPEGVIVSGPSLEAATRRWYEGELVVLTTASGQELSVTGNHPILTSRGWVPANLLDEGDEVVRSTRGNGAGSLMIPDHDQVPSRIEDIWGALAVSGFDAVPSTPKDFHGDGQHGEVHIVRSDSPFDLGGVSSLFKHGFERDLSFAPLGGVHFNSEGAAELLDLWNFPHPSCFIGGFDLLSLLGVGQSVVSHASSLAHSSEVDTSLVEAVGDGSSGYGVFSGKGVQTGPAFVFADDFFNRKVGPEFSRWDAPGPEFSVETRVGYASVGADLFHRLSGQVELDRVVKFVRREFKGHVYSVTSSEGWHSANSLIVSNCDCRHVPVLEDYGNDLVTNADEYFKSLSRAEQDRIFTKAGAEAIRNGADLNQVVNARRGMSRAQSGRQARDAYGFYSTTSGTSRRGLYGSSQTTFNRRTGARRRAVNRPRLMPESIQEIARDHDDYLRLLRLYRFII